MTWNDEECIDRWIGRALHESDERPLGTEAAAGFGGLSESGGRLLGRGRREFGRWIGSPGAVRLWLLNGDQPTADDSDRQTLIRERVQRTDVPVVVIPYSVLDAAGIDRDTVELIEDLPERFTDVEERSYVLPEGAQLVHERFFEWVPLSDQEIEDRLRIINDRKLLAARPVDGIPLFPPKVVTRADLAGSHALEKQVESSRVVLRDGDGQPITVEKAEHGVDVYVRTTERHWLGESLVRATAISRRPCGTCNAAGRVGRVRRLWWWSSGTLCGACHGSGISTTERTSYYLSGFDHQEPTPLYFFCELPQDASPTTVAEAYEALKPEPVRLAEQMGRTVHRQGDIFAVAAPSLTDPALEGSGASLQRDGYLLGTNHKATHVAVLPNGVTLARGTLTHDPGSRLPDHVDREMTPRAVWHVVMTNTVPPDWR